MNCEATLRFEFVDETVAQRVHKSLQADDDLHCETRQQGRVLEATLRGDTPRSLLRALDDLLGCAAVAEDVINEPDMGRDDAGH